MSAEFDGTGLMDCDVTGLRTENALIGAEKCVDDGSVCLGSAHEEIDSAFGAPQALRILSRADSENSSRPYPEVCIIFVESSSFMIAGWAPSM